MQKKPPIGKTLKPIKEIVMMADLKPAPYNPRGITPEAERSLRKSIEHFGLAGDIVWNKRTGNLILGHQRLKILKEEGYDSVEVIVFDLPLEEEKALNVHLNNKHAQGFFLNTVDDIMQDLREGRPDLYDNLRMFDIRSEVEYHEKGGSAAEMLAHDKTLKELEIRPFEHWDYIVFVFDNHTEWMNVSSRLGIEHLDVSPSPNHQKIGIGRVLKGGRLVQIVGEISEQKLKEIMAR